MNGVVGFYQVCHEYTGQFIVNADRNQELSSLMVDVAKQESEGGNELILQGRVTACGWNETKIIATCAIFVLGLATCVWHCRTRRVPAPQQQVNQVS